jgi:hypothetical protein
LKPIAKTFAGPHRDPRDQPPEGVEHTEVSSELKQFRHSPLKFVDLCISAPKTNAKMR